MFSQIWASLKETAIKNIAATFIAMLVAALSAALIAFYGLISTLWANSVAEQVTTFLNSDRGTTIIREKIGGQDEFVRRPSRRKL